MANGHGTVSNDMNMLHTWAEQQRVTDLWITDSMLLRADGSFYNTRKQVPRGLLVLETYGQVMLRSPKGTRRFHAWKVLVIVNRGDDICGMSTELLAGACPTRIIRSTAKNHAGVRLSPSTIVTLYTVSSQKKEAI